ncbi:hypothetical protein G3N56_12385 [Desulfovibrio sulfodismutans]|uniref:Tetratricopeptide repeat protein n=1 Tax=Desulfolutivibrio sulfodismutans TaxID=63561 RepID=A0A7K3NMW8_9BACT|nr:tetratricopeptide repeat protein [Desulfolutivibrio sulfodismutans]NDY57531.1 hypothetical protein [Desulfolutivibrio sulfodismutans]QLA14339.1 hypothetical protein GD606_19750 [Desulfolutivibrio sulfodismutans DSM 3696]
MRRRMTAICLVGLVLAILPFSGVLGQSVPEADVGYSDGAAQPAADTGKPRVETESPGAASGKAAAPKLSITLEGYENKDEPASAALPPDRGASGMEAVRPAAPDVPARQQSDSTVSPAPEPTPEPVSDPMPEPTPAPKAGPTPPRSAQKTSPRPSAPAVTRPSAPVGRPSPILSMLESTLRGNFSNTKAIARNLPGKYFDHVGDKSLAKKYSKQGNDLLNKQDNPPAALAAYQSAYENDPSSSEITGSYGYTLFRNGRFAEARDMEIESLEIAPEYAAAWFVLGQIYGYLQQEDMAYASFVNTCLFTKNITTSLGFLEREMKKYGEVTVQRAAGRALDACRRLSSGTADPGTVSSRPAPSEPGPLESWAGKGPATLDAPRAAPAAPAGMNWKNARIGKVDIQAAIMDSKLFQSMIGKMAKLPKAQVDAWLDSQIGPVMSELQGIIRTYARANNYLLVIQSKDEDTVRRGTSLRTSLNSLVEDDPYLAFLDSSEGRAFRKTAPIQDLTPIVSAKLGAR